MLRIRGGMKLSRKNRIRKATVTEDENSNFMDKRMTKTEVSEVTLIEQKSPIRTGTFDKL